jgi:hypothetical protein
LARHRLNGYRQATSGPAACKSIARPQFGAIFAYLAENFSHLKLVKKAAHRYNVRFLNPVAVG